MNIGIIIFYVVFIALAVVSILYVHSLGEARNNAETMMKISSKFYRLALLEMLNKKNKKRATKHKQVNRKK